MTTVTGFLPGPPLVVPGAGEGPLRGLRFAAKDLFDVRGQVTGAGNPDWRRTHAPARYTAPLVERMLAAGADLAGKTITDELAYSLIGDNIHYGAPRNVRAPERFTGGSSSGSAAVVAAGLVDFALGTDTAGSVRIPASHCGLFGFRPTHGALCSDGIVPLAPGFDVAGWLAADSRIFTRVGSVLFGRDDNEAQAPPRFAIAEGAFSLVADAYRAELRGAAAELAQRLGALPVQSLDRSLPLQELSAAFAVVQAAEAWRQHGTWIDAHAPAMADDILARFRRGAGLSAAEYRDGSAAARHHRGWLRGLFDTADVLLWPTSPEPALLRSSGTRERDAHRARVLELTAPASLAGLPQLTIPGWNGKHLPVGLSLIAGAGRDGLLLALAARLHGGGSGA